MCSVVKRAVVREETAKARFRLKVLAFFTTATKVPFKTKPKRDTLFTTTAGTGDRAEKQG